MSTSKSVLEMAKKRGAKMADIKFVDTFGTWQHLACPSPNCRRNPFSEGLGFDGSSIRGWKSIEASDMLAHARPGPAALYRPVLRRADPEPDLHHCRDRARSEKLQPRSPRASPSAAKRYLLSDGFGGCGGVRAGGGILLIFDNVTQFDAKSNGTFYSVDSEEAIWNTGREEMPNLGIQDPAQGRLFSPWRRRTRTQDIRTEMCLVMETLGIKIERQHHEEHRRRARHGAEDRLPVPTRWVKTADNMMLSPKYAGHQEHRQRSTAKTATFMPKPLFGDNGSGMHTHQSLWKRGQSRCLLARSMPALKQRWLSALRQRHLETREGAALRASVQSARPTVTSARWCRDLKRR